MKFLSVRTIASLQTWARCLALTVEHFHLGIFSFMLIRVRVNIIGINLVGLLCGSAAGTIGLIQVRVNIIGMNLVGLLCGSAAGTIGLRN
jgi:hypothetical protein